jgi:L-seryl-tRNA(Ser) seleniumtransferase
LPLFFVPFREGQATVDRSLVQALRSLPSVSEILADPELAALTSQLPPSLVTDVVRDTIGEARSAILAGVTSASDGVTGNVRASLESLLEPVSTLVINGTGVIIHTNLGRAPVSASTASAMATHSARYQALEIELSTGRRGGRGSSISRLMRLLTGAEKTLVVNNNAAAVLLTLSALTSGREVVISRGELVEIGGGFRIPDVLRQSGAYLTEVGTTNRTYLSDYEAATTDATAAYLKVHASNFAVVGFTAAASVSELAPLARDRGVWLIEDVGSGCLLDTREFGLHYEPTLAESVASGADVVCASGDKLLGGPQAGLILGSVAAVDMIASHPLARALRADKSCLAGLEETLRHYLRGEATEAIPVWWSISRDDEWLRQRVLAWSHATGSPDVSVISTESVVGGGSLPGRTLPSHALAIHPPDSSPGEIARALRTGTPGVVPRIVDDMVAIDARTVLSDEDDSVVQAVKDLLF